jgi:hypothetical protein
MSLDPKAIHERMFRRRLRFGEEMDSWTWISMREINLRRKQTALQFIEEKLQKGFKVTAGYVTTSVRGHHDYVVLFKK